MGRNTEENRSVKKTKKRLKDTLLELMSEKSIHKISVKEVTEKADVNRGTFYFHYSNIYELLADIEEDIFEEFESFFEESKIKLLSDSSFSILEPVFTILEEKGDIIYLLAGPNGDRTFSDRINAWISHKSHFIIGQVYPEANPENYSIISSFFIQGILGAFETWYKEDDDKSAQEMVEIVGKVIYSTPNINFKFKPSED